ncbi:hypothetical protein G3M48_010542 [Beauveria asiatica]|uniref:Uncharacterized protein n=1 Tax=Beauveria asiatica TaxID=1069075 RepID=A0AAW0RGW9_9HYPO
MQPSPMASYSIFLHEVQDMLGDLRHRVYRQPCLIAAALDAPGCQQWRAISRMVSYLAD